MGAIIRCVFMVSTTYQRWVALSENMKTMMFTIIFFSLLLNGVQGSQPDTQWPDRITQHCTKNTKQTASYGFMKFLPDLNTKPLTKMEVEVQWDDLQFAPYNPHKKGGVYISYTIKQHKRQGGYLGAQLHASRGSFKFSIWDGDRWDSSAGHHKQPKPSSQLVWPLNMDTCKRNCQDCGLPDLRPWKKKGLTTGTQCNVEHPTMKVGDRFHIRLERTDKQMTIDTKEYGGMPKAHAQFGETDRKVTGGVWMVTAANVKTNETIAVGKILFEGDGRGMDRLGTFDEMIGCNGCNMIQHKDTRYGPVVVGEDGVERKPVQMYGLTKPLHTLCKKYYVSGSKLLSSVSFESGPLTAKSWYMDNKRHRVW